MWNSESERYREKQKSSRSLTEPGVGGEPGRWDQVLAGVVDEIHIALAGPIVVRTDAVAFLPDKGGALTVGVEGGGAGLVVHRAIDCQEDRGEEQD